MAQKPDLFWRLDTWLFIGIALACIALGLYCFGWAAVIVLAQCFGWLKSGEWQGVPLYALFLSDDGQAMLRAYSVGINPLALVPSWGTSESLEQHAAAFAGSAMGYRKLVAWVLDIPLIVALIGAGCLCFIGFARAAQEARTSRDIAARADR